MMEIPLPLFQADPDKNLLPYDGVVQYLGPILATDEAHHYLRVLLETIPWKHDEAFIYGKRVQTSRKVAWYGDSQFSYTYSRITKVALLWTPELLSLKSLIEQKTQSTFNSCLCNLYHHGAEGMSWHSDDEKELLPNGAIASLSLGAERKFYFRHKTQKGDKPISIHLENGGLLVMKGSTQTFWQHSLPKSAKITTPRINLTFRTILKSPF